MSPNPGVCCLSGQKHPLEDTLGRITQLPSGKCYFFPPDFTIFQFFRRKERCECSVREQLTHVGSALCWCCCSQSWLRWRLSICPLSSKSFSWKEMIFEVNQCNLYVATALMAADTTSASATQRIFTRAAQEVRCSHCSAEGCCARVQPSNIPREQTQEEIPKSRRSVSWHSHLDQLSKQPKIHQNPVFLGKPFPSDLQSVGFMWELQRASFPTVVSSRGDVEALQTQKRESKF